MRAGGEEDLVGRPRLYVGLGLVIDGTLEMSARGPRTQLWGRGKGTSYSPAPLPLSSEFLIQASMVRMNSAISLIPARPWQSSLG